MSKVKKGKRVAAAAMAVALSMATVTTGVLPNTTVHVHAEEDGSVYKKIADSSVDGFYYEQNVWGYIQCTTDKTLEYSSYDEMIKKLSAITKKIVQENAYDRYSFSFPIKISSAAKDERFENDQVNKDLENEVYKEETGDPKGGHTMASMGGGLTNIYDITYSESEKAYIGEVTGSGGYGSKKERYDQAVKKLNEIIKNLNLDGKSDYEKFKAVTNWIVSNVRYDEDNETEYQHDLTGAVLEGLAVCDGYAGTFYYMANAVGLNALFEDGITNSNRIRHAWNLVEIDGTYYYADPTNAYFKKDGEPGKELLPGQKYLFSLYTPDDTTIENTYKNISQDDYLKEHSVCKGKHELGTAEKSKGATCTTAGYTSHKCTVPGCNYEEYEWIEPLGHEWSKEGTVTQEQSCENPEITTYKCERTDIWPACKATKQVETKPALGHTWDEGKITKEATCSETGVKTYTCSRCGGTKTEEIPKTKHDYEEHVVKAPTCTEKGISYYVCKNCGLTTSRRQTPATGHIHTEVRNQKDATYKEDGYTGDTYCKDCGKKLETGTVIPKLVEKEHDYGEWVLDQAPTCKKYGARHRICKNCGDREVDVLDKVDHTWDNGKVTKKATCTEDGEKTYTCTVCNTTKTEVIPATGHQHKEVRNAKKATCTEDGYTGNTYCKDCGAKLESGTVINKLGHTWDNGVITKEATETEEGVKTYTCKTCGETKTEKIPVTSHHWDQGTITKKATCTENGEKTYHCTDEGCDKTWIETIPATGHQHTELRDKKTATCGEDGYSGDLYCKDCGQLISKGAVVKATGHSWDSGKVTEAATCKKEGSKTYTCSICGDTKTEAIPKKDHTWDEGKVTKKATCTEDGLKVYTCRVCAETKEEVLKATGHQHTELRNEKKATCTEEGYTGDTYCTDCGELIKKGSVTEKANHNWQLTKEEKATCEKDGSKTYTCADCKETKIETIPATGHKFGDWQTVTTQSVFTGGVQKRICNVCGKEETRNVGNQLKATIKTNASSLKLKRKQATKKFVVSGLAAGDSVKSWTSSNQKIVKVFGSRNGACTIKAGNKTGKAKITITLESGLKKTINITVQKSAVACTSIKNVPKKLTLNRKKSYQLKPVISPITCTSKAKYKTSNKKIVKVTSRGKITAVKKGKAKITVMVGKKKFVCTVTIK